MTKKNGILDIAFCMYSLMGMSIFYLFCRFLFPINNMSEQMAHPPLAYLRSGTGTTSTRVPKVGPSARPTFFTSLKILCKDFASCAGLKRRRSTINIRLISP